MESATRIYEAGQSFNGLARFLHSRRHIRAADIAKTLHGELRRPVRIVDLGCGTGHTFPALAAACPVDYLGIDRTEAMIVDARKRYGDARFIAGDIRSLTLQERPDIVLALETLEHVPENDVVRLVEHVCSELKPRYFLVSVPVEIGPAVWIKNLGAALMRHDRKEYSRADTFWAGAYRLNRVPKHGIGHRGFDWRWLEQTIRYNVSKMRTEALPLSWLPRSLAPNVMFFAEP